MNFDTISVIGLGYIGLPTAAVIASRKKKVIGVDINSHAVKLINEGKIHIVEPDLDVVVHAVVTEGWLSAHTSPKPADAFLIAVPTPFKDDKEPDLRYIEAAARAIAPVLKAGNLVILESTSPVGATDQLCKWLEEARPDLKFPNSHGEDADICVAHCPERVLPGHVLRELVDNDRVIGGITKKCSEAATKLYEIFVEGECITTNARTAEMCKLTENSFRDVNIAFANELSVVCDELDINVWELISLANRHPRVNILQPGPGVGGHCIAVDPWFIVASAPKSAKMIRTARETNDAKPYWVVEKVKAAIADFLIHNRDTAIGDVKVACLGLAFKPDIDDLRESPALQIAELLEGEIGAQLHVVEPHIDTLPAPLSASSLIDIDSAVSDADILVLLVAHKAFAGVAARTKDNQILVQAAKLPL